MGRTSAIQDVQPQMDILDTLTETPDIDGGEAFLILSAYNNPTCRLATGDKRCLASLLATPSLSELVSSLSGRVYTLETALLILISRLDFDVVNHKVVRRCVDDGLLNLAFGEHRNEDHAIACLSSYSSNLKDLVAESHLIRY